MSWHNNNPEAKAVGAMLDGTINFHRTLVDIPVVVNGKRTRLGVMGALLLSQAIYWQNRTTSEDGWFYKTREEWEAETGLSRREQETARRRLRSTDFWEEEQRGLPPRLYYRIDLLALKEAIKRMQSGEVEAPTPPPAPFKEAEKPASEALAEPETKTDQTIGTNAPHLTENIQEHTDQTIGANPPNWASNWRESAQTIGANPPNWAEGALKELLTETTTETTLDPRLSKATTTARLTRVPAGAAAAAVAAANLPDEIRDALKALGWTGGMDEVVAAWQQDPARVRAWVEHAQRKGWSAALLRAVLREDPGYPPREPDPAARYLGDFAPDDAPAPADAPSPPEPPPDLPAPVRQWWQVVQGQLRREMSKAAFDAWVRDAYPLAFANANGEGEAAVLTIAAVNAYARDWLTERLTKTLERKLAGLAGEPVKVQFVVGEVSDA